MACRCFWGKHIKSNNAAFRAMSPKRPQGRPPVKQGEETVTVSLRMTPAQREKMDRLGGAKWVRDRIDRAKEPNA